VEVVKNFRYLGTMLDDKLSFSCHVDMVHKKAQQRLFLLRKLRSFDVSAHILQMVYQALIESILSFNIVTWFSHLNVREKNRLSRVVNIASKIIGVPQQQLTTLYDRALTRNAVKISCDKTHPLNRKFVKLPSGRRYRVPLAKKNIHRRSFVPSAISVLNAAL